MNAPNAEIEPVEGPMTAAEPTSSSAVLAILHSWADKGWLRRLDSAMATFMQELDASALQVAGVIRVMHDLHRVGLGKGNAIVEAAKCFHRPGASRAG